MRRSRRSWASTTPAPPWRLGRPANMRVLLTSDRGRDLVVRARPTLAHSHSAAAQPLALPASRPGAGKRGDAAGGLAPRSGLRPVRLLRAVAHCPHDAVRPSPSSTPTEWSGPQRIAPPRATGAPLPPIRSGSRSVSVVNTVPLEQYLRPVVPAESSREWPRRGAARTGRRCPELRRRRGRRTRARPFDVYDSTRSQVYRGRRSRSPSPGGVGQTGVRQRLMPRSPTRPA